MQTPSEKLLDEILRLPEDDRAAIAEQIIASLDSLDDPEVDKAWQAEINKRISELDTGRLSILTWEEVRNRLRTHSSASR